MRERRCAGDTKGFAGFVAGETATTHADSGGRVFFRPVVAIIQDGVVLQMTPTLSKDPRFATLEFSGTYAALARPIPQFEHEVEGQKLVTQHPEMQVLRNKATIRMKSGAYVLIRGTVPEFADGEHMTLIRLKIGTVGEFVRRAPAKRVRKR